MIKTWQTLWIALSNKRRENTELHAQIEHLTSNVNYLTAENELLRKHNEIMNESLDAAQAEVERLIQAAARPKRAKQQKVEEA